MTVYYIVSKSKYTYNVYDFKGIVRYYGDHGAVSSKRNDFGMFRNLLPANIKRSVPKSIF